MACRGANFCARTACPGTVSVCHPDAGAIDSAPTHRQHGLPLLFTLYSLLFTSSLPTLRAQSFENVWRYKNYLLALRGGYYKAMKML
jgi:hypothetical protein